jgi:hypothetical protein
MSALNLLERLCLAGVELRPRGVDLSFKAPAGVLDAPALAEIRAHKPQLLALLDGSTCRWCRQGIEWRGTDAIALADGTSLHGQCREPFDLHRNTSMANRTVEPSLLPDLPES